MKRWPLAVAVIITITAASTPANASSRAFISHPLDLGDGSYRMYDVGVTDYNGDGILDVYSTNHTTRMTLRPGNGTLAYSQDVVSVEGLDSDLSLPGVEAVGAPADTTAPGLYVYRTAPGKLVISANSGPVDATFTFYGGVVARHSGGLTPVVSTAVDDQGRPTNTVAITGTAPGTVTLTLELDAVTLDAQVTAPNDPVLIKLGKNAISPKSTDFSWFLHDRHGLSWTDLNGDGVPDMTIADGGLKGQLDTYPDLTSDEVLLAGTNNFTDATPPSLTAGHCRSRAVHWVDVNADGLLDLFITCEQEPARLLLGTPDGLVDDSNQLPRLPGAVPFLWIDLNGDRIPELIAATATGIAEFSRTDSGSYVRTKRLAPAATYTDLALADINHDGYPDIYAASPTASQLLLGGASGFRRVLPSHYGLPASANRAAWVDVDNDGRTDLFATPGGVYLQRKTGHFAASGLLTDLFPAAATNQLFAWFDGDNDGDRDLVGEYQLPGSYAGTVTMTENHYAIGHWLELDLVGPPSNRAAVGAYVDVTVAGVTTRHWVGESETSTSSQGHYRIYAGLGTATSTQAITVTWPDGTVQSVPNTGDAHVVVTHP